MDDETLLGIIEGVITGAVASLREDPEMLQEFRDGKLWISVTRNGIGFVRVEDQPLPSPTPMHTTS